MYKPREKVFWFAITSRLAVISLQFVFNILCPDHNADAFRTPRAESEPVSIFDTAVNVLLGGLTRWDAQYFMHIAKYGYTYENTLAFFPLYPMAVRYSAMLLKFVFFLLNEHSSITLAMVLINFVCFVKSAVVLYDLSVQVFGRTSVAYKAAIIYCINPASIFFTAGYSESMFAYLTFYSMLVSFENHKFVYLPIGLSALVRSNGLINIGFPLVGPPGQNCFLTIFLKIHQHWQNQSAIKIFSLAIKETILGSLGILNIIFLSLVPYFFLQVYNYVLFCTEYSRDISLPSHVKLYAEENNLIIAGNVSLEWCDANLPLAYSTIQGKYWNVGFLKYYELKQIPNFVLALPILWIMLKCVYRYCSDGMEIYSILMGRTNRIKRSNNLPVGMFVYVVHGLFLTLFSIFFVHIQVSTRLLASASPLLYWYCANEMSYKPPHRDESSEFYDEPENTFSKWKVFFMNQKNYTTSDKLILAYFLGYLLVGSFVHSNFLPWT